MFRNLGIALAATLAAALLVLVPTSSADAISVAGPVAQRTQPATWGRARAADQRLDKGCHRYAYTYRVTPPTGDWMAEVYLKDARGRSVAFRSFDSAADRASSTRTWKLCTSVVHAGRYTVRMKVTWVDFYEQHSGWVRDSHFRLRPVR